MAFTVAQLYRRLFECYGPQGWWPLVGHAGSNPTKTGAVDGYHPGDYSFPRHAAERFEIACGAILTQNTAWPNVERALLNLRRCNGLAANALPGLPQAELCAAIRPAGYYNIKARKLIEFCRFYAELNGRTPTRVELLAVWGIGPETADSIRLYAYSQLEMVVDAYTRRVLRAAGLARPVFPALGRTGRHRAVGTVVPRGGRCPPDRFVETLGPIGRAHV